MGGGCAKCAECTRLQPCVQRRVACVHGVAGGCHTHRNLQPATRQPATTQPSPPASCAARVRRQGQQGAARTVGGLGGGAPLPPHPPSPPPHSLNLLRPGQPRCAARARVQHALWAGWAGAALPPPAHHHTRRVMGPSPVSARALVSARLSAPPDLRTWAGREYGRPARGAQRQGQVGWCGDGAGGPGGAAGWRAHAAGGLALPPSPLPQTHHHTAITPQATHTSTHPPRPPLLALQVCRRSSPRGPSRPGELPLGVLWDGRVCEGGGVGGRGHVSDSMTEVDKGL